MELHERFAAMREYITEHGLTKFDLGQPGGPACIRGANYFTGGYNAGADKFLADLAIELRLWRPGSYIIGAVGVLKEYGPESAHVHFNNHPNTTEQDVIEFLHTAEIRAKEQA